MTTSRFCAASLILLAGAVLAANAQAETAGSRAMPLLLDDTMTEAYCGDALRKVANGQCGCCKSCTGGRDVCCPTMEEVTETRNCWKVTCEQVCVPAIRMPWEPGGSKLTLFSWLGKHHKQCACGSCVACVERASCGRGTNSCAPLSKCGAVRCVSVLEEDSYEVTTCKCKWEIRRLPACHPNGCWNHDCRCGEGIEREEIRPMETDDSGPPEAADLPQPPMPQP